MTGRNHGFLSHMSSIILLLLSYCPHEGGINVEHDTVDVQELNHFYDDQGRPVFDQFVWWRRKWSHKNLWAPGWKIERKYVNEYQLVDWRLSNSNGLHVD